MLSLLSTLFKQLAYAILDLIYPGWLSSICQRMIPRELALDVP